VPAGRGLRRLVDLRANQLGESSISKPNDPELTLATSCLIGSTFTHAKRIRWAGTMIIAADSNFGQILYDASGQAIYLFDAEDSERPQCYGDCAEAWPPVLTKGSPRATGAVRSSLLGTTQRSDGSMQITYSGHPLYFYAHEGKYQVLCHNVEEFGGTWLVVQPGSRPTGSWPATD
jgi:predicted lipoprotein with Yx(FWY)xxD motif